MHVPKSCVIDMIQLSDRKKYCKQCQLSDIQKVWVLHWQRFRKGWVGFYSFTLIWYFLVVCWFGLLFQMQIFSIASIKPKPNPKQNKTLKKPPKPPKHHKIKSYKQIRNTRNEMTCHLKRNVTHVHLGSALMSSLKVSQISTEFTFSKWNYWLFLTALSHWVAENGHRNSCLWELNLEKNPWFLGQFKTGERALQWHKNSVPSAASPAEKLP